LIEVKGMNAPKALPLDQGGMVGANVLLPISFCFTLRVLLIGIVSYLTIPLWNDL